MNSVLRVNPELIAIAATTLYPNWYPGPLENIGDTDKVRGDLALELVRIVKMAGYQLVIADGASSEAFKQELSELKVLVVSRNNPQRAMGRKLAIQKAAKLDGVKVIIRTEPEKISIVEMFAQTIALPIINGEVDIVVPNREDNHFRQSYPGYMYDSEKIWNKKYNHLLHKTGLLPPNQILDIAFGPVALRNDQLITSLFEEYSEAQTFPLVKALSFGLRILTIEIPFAYPPTQKQNENTEEGGAKAKFIEKRNQQRKTALTELTDYIRLLKHKKSNKII